MKNNANNRLSREVQKTGYVQQEKTQDVHIKSIYIWIFLNLKEEEQKQMALIACSHRNFQKNIMLTDYFCLLSKTKKNLTDILKNGWEETGV